MSDRGGRGRLQAPAGSAGAALLCLSACSFDPTAGSNLGPTAMPDASVEKGDVDAGVVERPDAVPPIPQSGLGLLVSDAVAAGPVVDGELDPMWEDRLVTFSVAEAMLLPVVHDDYEFDAEVRFASVHTDENVYFVFEVHDSLTIWQPMSPYEDSLTVYVDGAGDRDGPHRDDDHRFRLSAKGHYTSFGEADAHLDDFAMEYFDGGYRFELALSKDWLSGDEVGFDMAVIDNDLLGNLNVDAIGVWYSEDKPRCESCCDGASGLYCDTTYYGSLLLQ